MYLKYIRHNYVKPLFWNVPPSRVTHLKSSHPRCYCNIPSMTETKLTIGDVTKELRPPSTPAFVPTKYTSLRGLNQTDGYHLRWMLQKDKMGQDMFLIGPPGSFKRLLALQYLQLTQQELEYIALSRDTTESDLKQRREIVNGTAQYFDQCAVNAARHGRILILDGIEKAERNVLPVLNNLLENREMHLEDGRLLIPATRYDSLCERHTKAQMDAWKLVRVHENFRIIALGLPTPKFAGNALDPPLRSRFQARNVTSYTYNESLEALWKLTPNVDFNRVEQLTNVAFALLTPESDNINLPFYPIGHLRSLAQMVNLHTHLDTYNLIYRSYPYRLFLTSDGIVAVERLLEKLQVELVSQISQDKHIQPLTAITGKSQNSSDNVNCGSVKLPFVETAYQNALIHELAQTISVSDACLVGPKGCGKTVVIKKLAELLGINVETIAMYQDMTSRDLLQQRTTLANGDTVWVNSSLVNAAIAGQLTILDGIHRVHPSTLNVLQRLIHDRELQLFNGERLLRADRYDELKTRYKYTDAQLATLGVHRIHPNFRIVAVAEPINPNASQTSTNWMTPELLGLFLFHEARALNKIEETQLIATKCGAISEQLQKVINLAHVLREHTDPVLRNLCTSLSTRKLLHIAAKMHEFPHTNVHDLLQHTFLTRFLPNIVRDSLESAISHVGIRPSVPHPNDDSAPIKCVVENGRVQIGETIAPIFVASDEFVAKVPNVTFYNVPTHMRLLECLLQDMQLGSHLLLIGNQGVGKNKVADRLLQLLNRPREYIQLHRDTTVQTLTVQPTIKDGVIHYEDSPLVKAVRHGHVLIVDEADKAPTHVTSILKSLVESGEMTLSDGRRIVSNANSSKNSINSIVTHKDFRMIVLANRPGFPFLGNDFFGALGDLFSCYAVDNPTPEAEVRMLKQYGPNVPENVIRQLVAVFSDLRAMADQGLVTYPYSTREVVNVVRHLANFPAENVADAILNVFDFDVYSDDVRQTLHDVLSRHGFPSFEQISRVAKNRANVQVTVESTSGKETSEPKHGKEDPNNDPHVGGNTWAGGTGGRDTAGLGGKGGPYRLDKGHKVHQLSDAEKDAVPEHVKRAAREMGRKAFEARLKEIAMSEYDADLYEQFLSGVRQPIKAMRMILSSLQAKTNERLWSKNQTSGELDDGKLIEGLTGEKSIYRKRTDQLPEMGQVQLKPKRLKLVVDVSGSMYRFNSYDERLDRELEAVVLVMESFQGFENKIRYDIVGHSGDDYAIKFVDANNYPSNEKERLDVLRTMHSHAQFCWSGDHTLEATKTAIDTVGAEDCDEAIVIVLSDANLRRYGIPARKLGNILVSNPKVSAHAIFIGSLGEEATNLVRELPSGKGFYCDNMSQLPLIIKQIFTASINSSYVKSNL